MDECQYSSLPKGCLDRSGRGVQKGISPLGKGGLPPFPNLLCERRSHKRTNDRCVRGGLVGCSPPKHNLGRLAGRMKKPIHELERTESSTSIPKALSGRVGRIQGEGVVGQHDGPLLPEEGGIPSFDGIGGFDRRDLPFPRGVRYLDPSHTSEGKDQCISGSRFQAGPYSNRMVPGR